MLNSISPKNIKIFSACLLLVFSLVSSARAEDLKVEEIINKHRASIGSQEKLDEIKTRLAVGTSEFIIKVPYNKLVGKALVASELNNLMFVSSFNSRNYPFERIGLFSDKVNIPFVVPGAHSPLGGFLHSNNKIITEKLLTGSISNTWAFLQSNIFNSKLRTDGKKKIDGRETYILSLVPKGGSSEFTIRLFFDAETFHHLRTEYMYKYPTKEGKMGSPGNDNPGGKDVLIEDFREFKAENGLTLPHSYKLSLLFDSPARVGEFEWKIAISQYVFNQKLDADFFNFDKFEAAKQ